MEETDRRIVQFTAAAHGLVHTYELSIPILMTVWLVEFSTTAATLGLIVTVGYAFFGIGALPGGVLVDRYGSKLLILACLGGMAGSFVLLGLSGSILSLAVAVAVWGIAASVYHPAGLALLSTRVERTGMAFGYHGIGGNVGIALGPLATVLLLLWLDWRTVSIILAVPAVVVLALGLFVDTNPESTRAAAADGGDSRGGNDTKGRLSLSTVVDDTRALATVAFGLVIVVVMMNGLYYRAFLTFLPDLLGDLLGGVADVQLVDPDGPYAEEFDLARYAYVAILIAGVAGQYFGGRLAERLAVERALGYVFGSLVVLALLFVPASSNLVAFAAVSLLLGVAVFTIQPLEQAAVAKYAPPGTEGLSFGYTFLAIFGIGASGAAIAGFVLTYASVVALFAVLGGIAAIAATISFVLLRRDAPGRVVSRSAD